MKNIFEITRNNHCAKVKGNGLLNEREATKFLIDY